jgi:hypothetical protein
MSRPLPTSTAIGAQDCTIGSRPTQRPAVPPMGSFLPAASASPIPPSGAQNCTIEAQPGGRQ